VRRPVRRPSRAGVAPHEQGRQGADPGDTQRAGQFQFFINACLHRGATVEIEARGTKRRFTCPFHAWTYDPDEALVDLPEPDHFGEFDTEFLGLKPLPTEERGGLFSSALTLVPSSTSTNFSVPGSTTSSRPGSVDTLSQSRRLVHIQTAAETQRLIGAHSDRLAAAPDHTVKRVTWHKSGVA
jgi:nitrite reductase/ring-hydroxylating ferredoxin subunit